MVNEKFKDVKFNFPKDPMNTEFIKIWQETIEREDFKNLKKQVLKEEREEPKRYYLRPKGMKLIRTNFVFNYYVNDGDWSLYGKDETRLAKTRFTLKELDGLGIDVEHYDLEEVE